MGTEAAHDRRKSHRADNPRDLALTVDRMQAELETLRGELEQSHRLSMLGILASGIAHEVNNILTPALSLTELALADPSNEDRARTALERASSAIVRASEIAQAILTLGAGIEDPHAFHVERRDEDQPVCNVRDAVDQALLCLGKDPNQLGIDLRIHIAPTARAAIRPIALEQILLNLMLNAIRAMPSGGVLEIAAEPAEGGRVRIVVADDGAGIEPERLHQIFESFVTFDNSLAASATRRPRYGLGLVVCRQLLDAAGGSIDVVSAPGEGSTFTVELPSADRIATRRCA